MLQCCLYCECNVSANRTQSDESWLSKAMLRCSLTSRMQCQCQPNAELENLFSKVLLRCSLTSRMQCQCQPNAELENLFSKVLLRRSLTSRMQRYNMHNPKSKFFRCLISHLESFSDLRMCIQPFIYGHFGAFFILEKKMKSGYNILSLDNYQNVRNSNILPHQNTTVPTPFFY